MTAMSGDVESVGRAGWRSLRPAVARPRAVASHSSYLAPLLALPVLAPLLYLLWLASRADLAAIWQTLARNKAGELAIDVAVLAAVATLWAVVLGVPWAWLVARTDVPGRRLFRWLGALPLAVPPYVGALCYALLLARGGLVHRLVAEWRGAPTREFVFPQLIYGQFGAAFVLGLFGCPYVYLTVYGALGRIDPALGHAARTLGLGPWGAFRRVTLPLLRPAILAGGLLVFLYSWVDFGVVSLLRARTFTTVIYNSLLAGFSLPSAAALSLPLIAIVWTVLSIQRPLLGRASYAQEGARSADRERIALGAWHWPACAFLCLAVALTLGVPFGVLGYQLTRLGSPAIARDFLVTLLPYVRNSLVVATLGATGTLLLAGGIGWLRWRGDRGGRGLPALLAGVLLQAGYAMPGTVLGFALVGLTLAFAPRVYGTPAMLIFAYLVLFAAPALQGVGAALAGVSPRLEEAARVLGCGSLGAAMRVVVPLAGSGLAGAWLLTFALSLRELSATILLRPAGYDTLPVRLWTHTMDVGPDPRAAVVALVLVALVGLPWLALLRLQGDEAIT